MSLNVRQLEKVRELGNGVIQARCPACAEHGGDRAGKHLRVYADGRFGCCVFPKDGEHRKRIFVLAGDRSPRTFTIRAASRPAAESATSVVAVLSGFRGTPGTTKTHAASTGESPSAHKSEQGDTLGTLGTPFSKSRAYARKEEQVMCDDAHACKDSKNGVPSVPSLPKPGRMPYLTADGTLVIPFDSPKQFHWWKGGQSAEQTRMDCSTGL